MQSKPNSGSRLQCGSSMLAYARLVSAFTVDAPTLPLARDTRSSHAEREAAAPDGDEDRGS
jgi:hypothetical protein